MVWINLQILVLLWGLVGGQRNAPPGSDFVDTNVDGSYNFGYNTGDEGGHYHSAGATADNTVTGSYGYREPGSGRLLQTSYTAGERGFRAVGTSIARRMDLSQAKIPYNPPVSPNSPNYNPSYSTYFDPNEDPSYDFAFNTPTYKRQESGGPRGDVSGSYSYMDDAGEWHNVAFEAGSQTGFHIKTPFPDSTPFGGVFFTGPDGRPSGPPRGRTSIQRSVDGSYRFTSSGPDQRRTEVSDAQGNVRGSYTYIDDKGVQRSVHYIAGPNIGYKIINKGLGPSVSPFPPSRPDYNPPKPVRPSRPSNIPEPSSYDEGLFGSSPVNKPGNSKNKPPSGPFDGDFAENSPPTVGSDADDFLSESKNPLIGEEEAINPQYTSCCEEKPDSDKKDSFLGGSSTDTTSTAKPISQPESEFLPPLSAFPEDDPSAASKQNSVSLEDDFLKKPFSSLPPPVRESRFYSTKSYSDTKQSPNPFYINEFSDSDKKFSGFPPGVSVKARIQSLDIRPFGSRIPPPGIALEQSSDSHSRT